MLGSILGSPDFGKLPYGPQAIFFEVPAHGPRTQNIQHHFPDDELAGNKRMDPFSTWRVMGTS